MQKQIKYVVNLDSKMVHMLIDGRAFESCNIDQIKDKEVLPYLIVEPPYIRCKRCFKINSKNKDKDKE